MSPKLQADWIAPARTALLLIDMQVDFAAPDGVMGRLGADLTAARGAVAQAARLADAARAAEVPCIFTRYVAVPGRESRVTREAKARLGRTGDPVLCLEGSPGAEFAGPQPAPGDIVITKDRFSVFPGTGLAETLQGQGIDTLVLCGLTTECCIQSSAWDAFERDFHVILAVDACAAYEPGLHEAALRSLELSGAIAAAAAAIVAAWK